MSTLKDLKIGDLVTRFLSSEEIPMKLKITDITNDLIVCGAWKFDKETGAEIDEELKWNKHCTGSYIKGDK